MTVEEFYQGPPWLCRAFLKKREYENDRANMLAWMQGAYIYETLLLVAPIYHAFAKNPRPGDYPQRPHELFQKKGQENNEVRNIGDESERVKAVLQAYALQHNRALRNKEPKPEQEQPDGGSGE